MTKLTARQVAKAESPGFIRGLMLALEDPEMARNIVNAHRVHRTASHETLSVRTEEMIARLS